MQKSGGKIQIKTTPYIIFKFELLLSFAHSESVAKACWYSTEQRSMTTLTCRACRATYRTSPSMVSGTNVFPITTFALERPNRPIKRELELMIGLSSIIFKSEQLHSTTLCSDHFTEQTLPCSNLFFSQLKGRQKFRCDSVLSNPFYYLKYR